MEMFETCRPKLNHSFSCFRSILLSDFADGLKRELNFGRVPQNAKLIAYRSIGSISTISTSKKFYVLKKIVYPFIGRNKLYHE